MDTQVCDGCGAEKKEVKLKWRDDELGNIYYFCKGKCWEQYLIMEDHDEQFSV